MGTFFGNFVFLKIPSISKISRILFGLLAILTPALGHADGSSSCAQDISSMVDLAFTRFTDLEADAERTQKLLKTLKANRGKIETRIRNVCPESSPCPPATLVHAVVTAVEEEIANIDSPNVKVGWRVWTTVGLSVITYVGLSTAAQSYMTSISATMAVAFLTYFGTSALDAVGAPVLEYVLPPVRRWMYANNNLAQQRDLARGAQQQRHRLFHMLQQELISETEANGRTTDTEVILRLLNALTVCSAGGDCEKGRARSAEIIAKLVTHVMKHYPEVDLRHSDYAEWVQALYSKWDVPDSEQMTFAARILERIENHYDLRARSDANMRKRYEAVLISWFALEENPLPAVIPVALPQLDAGDGI